MRTVWTARTVTDVVGTAGSVVLDDEATARAVLEDWLHDYYEGLDADDTAWIMDAATGSGITYEANETLIGGYGIRVEYDSEWSAGRAGDDEPHRGVVGDGEPGTSGDEALAEAWWKCGDDGEGWITDEADVEIAAEYLYAAAHEN